MKVRGNATAIRITAPLLGIALSLLVSCGGSSPSSMENATDGSTDSILESSPDLNKLAGLWDASTLSEDGLSNVFYVEIIAQGVTDGDLPGSKYDWDYMADDVGTGDDCYDSSNFEIVALGNDLYRLRQEIYLITVSGPLMTLTNQTLDSDPVTYRRIDGFESADFLPC